MPNPILEEIYDIRRQILAEHQHDLTEYLRAGLAQTKASGHPIAKLKQRTIRCTRAVKSGGSPMESESSPSGDR